MPQKLSALLLLTALLTLAACSDPSGQDNAGACASSTLVAQCPPGSNPILGATADSLCEASAQGDLVNAQGAVSGRCYGEQTCQVACQFASPCQCGVDRVTQEGVFCIDCDTVSACGDGLCADGETVQSCPEDCGAVCSPGDMRCDGASIQSCNQNGRFDTLACPSGESCVELGAQQVDCRSDSVVDVDAGNNDQPDMEELVANGRIWPGPATWPGSQDDTPPALDQRPQRRAYLFSPDNNNSPLLQQQGGAAGIDQAQLLFTQEAGQLQLCDPDTWRCYLHQGWLDLVPTEDFCGALHQCDPGYFGDCEQGDQQASSWPSLRDRGAPYLRCVYEELQQGQCQPGADNLERSSTCAYQGEPSLSPSFTSLGRSLLLDSSPDSRYLAFDVLEGDQARLYLLDTRSGQETRVAELGDFRALRAALNNQGQLLFTAQNAGSLIRGHWSPGDAEPTLEPLEVSRVDPQELAVHSLALSPNGELGAVALRSGGANGDFFTVVYHLAENRELLHVLDAAGPLAFSPTNGQLATVFQRDYLFEIWDLPGQRRLGELQGQNNATRIAFHPSGQLAATWDGALLRLWDTQSFSSVMEDNLGPYQSTGSTLRFSPDGSTLWAWSAREDVHGFWTP